MKERNTFRRKRMSLAVLLALATPAGLQLAHAGAGWGDSADASGAEIKTPTYYANSPAGLLDTGACFSAPPSSGAFDTLSLVPPSSLEPTLGGNCDTGTALRKFVDTLPGLDTVNNLGNSIPVAVADKTTYPGSDYYEIAVVEYTQKMHTDLAKATTLRGYVQISATGTVDLGINLPDGSPAKAVAKPSYLGPIINSTSGTPTRIKFYNLLPAGAAGNLHIPVDETLTGAGIGPDNLSKYQQNRVEIHLHGGDNPWISDGTPHQWILPAADEIALSNPANSAAIRSMARGVGAKNVPDMPNPGPGAMTYYFPNGQSGRMMWYHDHTLGLTRLNVYSGVAAGYLLNDLPNVGENFPALANLLPEAPIPLIIQDKTFVPKDIATQDAKWNGIAQEGDLWYPHVYETNQDPNSFDATNPVGRWDWGPWFWPVFPSTYDLPTGEVNGVNAVTGLSEVSTTPEAFMDTPLVNGTAYPSMTVEPKAYRFRVLNASNDRFLNLGLYLAADKQTTNPDVPTDSTHTVVCDGVSQRPDNSIPTTSDCTEVKMVNFDTGYTPPTAAYTADGTLGFPTSGGITDTGWGAQVGGLFPQGAPDPATAGPHIVQIGNEAGLLANPLDIPSTPLNYEYNKRSVTVLGIQERGLYLGTAERADVLIDFSQYAGKTLILYNDSPAPVPASDPRIDYYTGNGDNTGVGGAPNTKPGFGPNTRTVMQIVVAPTATGTVKTVDVPALQAALPQAYASVQAKPVVPEPEFGAAFAGMPTTRNNARIYTGSIYLNKLQGMSFNTPEDIKYFPTPTCNSVVTCNTAINAQKNNPVATAPAAVVPNGNGLISAPAGTPVNVYVQNKAIQELFDPAFGRMNATLGIELPFTSALTQTTLPLAYVDPVTETVADGETQFWKITHNGVDVHPVHFHLVNVQVINRMGWDGTVKIPNGDEIGWKETVKMNPLEDVVVAVRAKKPTLPGFGLPISERMMDPSQPAGSALGFTQVNPATGNPLTVLNAVKKYGWEYAWHCHILGHEENDFMRPVKFDANEAAPVAPTLNTLTSTPGQVTLDWTDNSATEYEFQIQRADVTDVDAIRPNGDICTGTPCVETFATLPAPVSPALANASQAVDTNATGVEGNATFAYQVCAVGAAGTSCSTTQTIGAIFTVPNAPTGLIASATSASTIALSWADNSINEKGFLLERSVAGNNVWEVVTPQVVGGVNVSVPANIISANDVGLAQNTAYDYRLSAVNTAGASATVTTTVTTPYAPAAAISGLAASVNSDTAITLNWAAPATGTATAIIVTRNGSVIATLSATDSSYADTGLTQNTAYTYAVHTVNGPINVGADATVTATTDYAVAPAMGAVGAVANSPTQVTLSWSALSPVTAYTIVRDSTVIGSAPANATAYVDATATQNTTYTYAVTPVNGPNVGAASTSNAVTTPYADAGTLTGFTAAGTGTGAAPSVTLAWTGGMPATTDVLGRCEQTVANLNCTSVLSVFTPMNVAPTGSYVDTAVVANTSYFYQLQAFNGSNLTPSNIKTASVTTPSLGITVAPPTALTGVVSAVPARVRLTWADVAVAPQVAPTAFIIMRSIDGVNFSQVGTVGPTARAFNDAAVALGNTYTYKVIGQNVTGAVTTNSVDSNRVSVQYAVPAIPTAPVRGLTTTTSVALSWAAVPNATSYTLYRNGVQVWVGAGTSRTQSGQTAGNTYTFTVRANNVLGSSLQSTGLPVTMIAAAPAAPAATAGVVGSKVINLALPALPTSATSFNVLYQVRSGNTGIWSALLPLTQGVTGVTYQTPVLASGQYRFRLAAVNVSGVSGNSGLSNGGLAVTAP